MEDNPGIVCSLRFYVEFGHSSCPPSNLMPCVSDVHKLVSQVTARPLPRLLFFYLSRWYPAGGGWAYGHLLLQGTAAAAAAAAAGATGRVVVMVTTAHERLRGWTSPSGSSSGLAGRGWSGRSGTETSAAVAVASARAVGGRGGGGGRRWGRGRRCWERISLKCDRSMDASRIRVCRCIAVCSDRAIRLTDQ